MTQFDYKYHIGFNKLLTPFQKYGSCVPGGLYFTDIEHIENFYPHGTILCEVYLPMDEPDFECVPDKNDKWRANMLIIKNTYSLFDLITYAKFGLDLFKNVSLVDKASEIGNIEFLNMWKNSILFNYLPYSKNSIDLASKNNKIESLNWWINSGLTLKYSGYSIDYACEFCHKEMIELWFKSGLPLNSNFPSMEISFDKHLNNDHRTFIVSDYAINQAFKNNFDYFLKMYIEHYQPNEFKESSMVFIIAIDKGLLNIEEYVERLDLRELIKSKILFEYAAQKGLIKFFEKCAEKIIPEKTLYISSTVLNVAIKNNHYNIIQWFIKYNAVNFNRSLCSYDDDNFILTKDTINTVFEHFGGKAYFLMTRSTMNIKNNYPYIILNSPYITDPYEDTIYEDFVWKIDLPIMDDGFMMCIRRNKPYWYTNKIIGTKYNLHDPYFLTNFGPEVNISPRKSDICPGCSKCIFGFTKVVMPLVHNNHIVVNAKSITNDFISVEEFSIETIKNIYYSMYNYLHYKNTLIDMDWKFLFQSYNNFQNLSVVLQQNIVVFELKKLYCRLLSKKFFLEPREIEQILNDRFYQEKQIVNDNHYVLNCYFCINEECIPSRMEMRMIKINESQIKLGKNRNFEQYEVSEDVKNALLEIWKMPDDE